MPDVTQIPNADVSQKTLNALQEATRKALAAKVTPEMVALARKDLVQGTMEGAAGYVKAGRAKAAWRTDWGSYEDDLVNKFAREFPKMDYNDDLEFLTACYNRTRTVKRAMLGGERDVRGREIPESVDVEFAPDGESYTDGRMVHIDTSFRDLDNKDMAYKLGYRATLDDRARTAFQFNLVLGSAYHEFGHILFTDMAGMEDHFRDLERKGYVTKIMHSIENIIEDRRMEEKVMDAHPGFEPAMALLRRHHFCNFQADHADLIAKMDPVSKTMNTLLLMVKFPESTPDEWIRENYGIVTQIRSALTPFPETHSEMQEASLRVYDVIARQYAEQVAMEKALQDLMNGSPLSPEEIGKIIEGAVEESVAQKAAEKQAGQQNGQGQNGQGQSGQGQSGNQQGQGQQQNGQGQSGNQQGQDQQQNGQGQNGNQQGQGQGQGQGVPDYGGVNDADRRNCDEAAKGQGQGMEGIGDDAVSQAAQKGLGNGGCNPLTEQERAEAVKEGIEKAKQAIEAAKAMGRGQGQGQGNPFEGMSAEEIAKAIAEALKNGAGQGMGQGQGQGLGFGAGKGQGGIGIHIPGLQVPGSGGASQGGSSIEVNLPKDVLDEVNKRLQDEGKKFTPLPGDVSPGTPDEGFGYDRAASVAQDDTANRIAKGDGEIQKMERGKEERGPWSSGTAAVRYMGSRDDVRKSRMDLKAEKDRIEKKVGGDINDLSKTIRTLTFDRKNTSYNKDSGRLQVVSARTGNTPYKKTDVTRGSRFALSVLLDESGSMGNMVPLMRETMYMFSEVGQRITNADVFLYGFTSGYRTDVMLDVFRERGRDGNITSREAPLFADAIGGTPTGEAIDAVCERIAERTNAPTLLLVVTDGEPANDQRCASAVKRAEADGFVPVMVRLGMGRERGRRAAENIGFSRGFGVENTKDLVEALSREAKLFMNEVNKNKVRRRAGKVMKVSDNGPKR